METVSNANLESLIEVKAIVEKQGFKVAAITTVKRFVEYDVTATYGDTSEIYAITVEPMKGTYTVEYRV